MGTPESLADLALDLRKEIPNLTSPLSGVIPLLGLYVCSERVESQVDK